MAIKFEICEMTAGDIPAATRIEKECIPEPWSEKAFFDEFANDKSIMLCAKANDELAGFITAFAVLDEVNIYNVAVTEKYRRNGIAGELLNALQERVKSFASFITLEVRESNLSAINLYKNKGYTEVGLRKNYYSLPKENAILMTKFL